MTPEGLAEVLADHALWLRDGGGKRANLRGVDLRGTRFGGSNLAGAHLGEQQIIQVGPLGSRRDYLVVVRHNEGDVSAQTGCFRGTLAELEQAVATTHAEGTVHRQEYEAAMAYVRAMLKHTGMARRGRRGRHE